MSQIGRNIACTNSHVVIAHNTLANQTLTIRNTGSTNVFDSYCVISSNVMQALGATVPPANIVAADNHLFAGAGDPAWDTGTVISGTLDSLYVDQAAGDYTPAGELLTDLKAPRVKYDQNKVARGATATVGALV